MRKDSTVFSRNNTFAAWPAAKQCWAWGNELLVSFEVGTFKRLDRGHAIDREKERFVYFARSMDGGKSWNYEEFDMFQPEKIEGNKHPELLSPFEDKMDFLNPDHIMIHVMGGHHPGDFSWWYASKDRGKTWSGPYAMQPCDQIDTAYQMRTRMIPIDHDRTYLFITCANANGEEGRVCCVVLKNGGTEMEFRGWIGMYESDKYVSIMPEATQRQNGELVVFLRCWDISEENYYHIDQYTSSDGGYTWKKEDIIVDNYGGNPPAFGKLGDGTWVISYGCRNKPLSISCRWSENEGKTWSNEIMLRCCHGCPDLGYPRMSTLPDGSIIVYYYFNKGRYEIRTIEATIFDKEYLMEESEKEPICRRK